jgi:hypothetical protein
VVRKWSSNAVLGTLLIRTNFRQMAMYGENSPKIMKKQDGQAE